MNTSFTLNDVFRFLLVMMLVCGIVASGFYSFVIADTLQKQNDFLVRTECAWELQHNLDENNLVKVVPVSECSR